MTTDRQAQPTGADISQAIVALLRRYTGRGPAHVRTTVAPEVIVVTLRENLSKAEQTLADNGQGASVLAMRRAFQETMREDLIATVEQITGRTVEAFLSDNLHDPDVAIEVFLMHTDETPDSD